MTREFTPDVVHVTVGAFNAGSVKIFSSQSRGSSDARASVEHVIECSNDDDDDDDDKEGRRRGGGATDDDDDDDDDAS